MTSPARFLMVDPSRFEVAYVINPWMQPDAWRTDAEANARAARAAWESLKLALEDAGAEVEVAPGGEGLPDMVFPANCAVVLDGRALLGRFRKPERRGEEALFEAAFTALNRRGLVREVARLPEGLFQEGAGDCLWDPARGCFWSGYGPRSSRGSAEAVADFFGREAVPLELVSDCYYHLDVCFCPLSGGELLYHPSAFSPAGLAAIRDRVPADLLVEADDEDAANFCVNAVNVGRRIVTTPVSPRLRGQLEERGYTLADVDLAPFLMSGGGAYCMSLRLDLTSAAAPQGARAAPTLLAAV
jgi:N-dimethylarginine dimethylaminohydrolase